MMREILFRAKIVGENEWVYGHYVHQYNSDMIYLPNGSDRYGFDYHHIDTNTLGQYTGLTDKNGKRIFEGDIVSCDISPYYRILIVDFIAGAFVVKEKGNHVQSPLYHFTHTVEVIGNVFDNADLLEVQDE